MATINGTAGNDSLTGTAEADSVSGLAGNDTLEGRAGNDTLNGGGGSGDEASYERAAQRGAVVTLATDGTHATDDGDGGSDVLVSIEHITGTQGFGDDITGNSGDNRLRGLGGNDTLEGRSGRDTLDGGDGDDHIEPGNGTTTVDGGAGADTMVLPRALDSYVRTMQAPDRLLLVEGATRIELVRVEQFSINGTLVSFAQAVAGLPVPAPTPDSDDLRGSVGPDSIDALAGNDFVEGDEGNDTLEGNEGQDQLFGQAGDDQLSGGLGDDRLDGGIGNDTLISAIGDTLISGPGNDRIAGNGGTLSFADDPAGVAVTLASTSGGSGTATDGWGGQDTVAATALALRGSAFNDTLTGRDHDTVEGGPAPHDDLRGGDGNDTLVGGRGDDNLGGETGNDLLQGGTGFDALFGGDGDDRLEGDDASDALFPGAGNDTLQGGAGTDTADYLDEPAGVVVNLATLRSSKAVGTDELIAIEAANGSQHADRFIGDSGNNRFSGRGGNDSFEASAGIDWIDYDDYTLPAPTNGSGVTVLLPASATQPGSAQDGHGGTDSIQFGAAEQVRGSRYHDAITGSPLIAGDSTSAGGGHDTLWGADGNDTLAGLSGDDSLDGGPGDDRLTPGLGDDTVDGGTGTDTLVLEGPRSSWGVAVLGNGALLLSTAGGQRVQLKGVETLQFSDGPVAAASLGASGVLVASWSFNNTLAADQPGLPALVSIDPRNANGFGSALVNGSSRTVFNWAGAGIDPLQQGGLRLNANNLVAANSYSIELVFRFAATASDGWRRIVDTQNRQSDNGFYVGPGNRLEVYPDVEGIDEFTTGVFHTVVMSNLVTDGVQQVIVYLDGVPQMQSATNQLSLDNANNPERLLHFFVDNLADVAQTEWAPGSIASLKLFNGIVVPDAPVPGQTITGTAAADTLTGGAGKDTISGQAGNDSLDGGDGNDRLEPGSGHDTVAGGAGDDLLVLPAARGGYAGVQEGSAIRLTLSGGSSSVLLTGIERVAFSDGEVPISEVQQGLVTVVNGTEGNDTLQGTAGPDQLNGRAGDDLLLPGGGFDSVNGGDGFDRVSYANRADGVTVDLQAGRSFKTDGDDTLSGVEGAIGGSGADSLTGDSGSNSFQGRAGDDHFEASAGIDTLDYQDPTLPAGTGVIITLPSSRTTLGSARDGHGGTDRIELGAAEQVQGSDGPDSITGAAASLLDDETTGSDSLWGNGGNDTLVGQSGDDQLAGGPGDDLLRPGDGRDRAIGGDGTDVVELAVASAPFVVSRSGADLLLSRDGGLHTVLLVGVESVRFSDQTLTIEQLTQQIGQSVLGSAGNDTLRAGSGNDTLVGLAGDDLLIDDAGSDRLEGGEETARYDVDIVAFPGPSAVNVDLAAGRASRANSGTGTNDADTLAGFEAVFGSAAADTLRGADSTQARDRGETLRGGAGNDTIDGGSGVDSAEYRGNRADYTVTRTGENSWTVRDDNLANGDEGSDTLTNIERLVFADQMLAGGSRAEEIARVAFVLWNPAIAGSTTLFARAFSYYDNGYAFEQMSRDALAFWSADSDAQLAARLVANSGTAKSAADLLATMATNGGGLFGRAAAVREAALDAGTTAAIEASNIRFTGIAALNIVPGFGQLFGLLEGEPG